MVTAAPVKAPAPRIITIPSIDVRTLEVSVVGDSGLISHAWSDKAKKMMLDKQMKKAAAAKEAKDPEAQFHESLYVISGQAGQTGAVYGFPAVAFKAAAVSACRFVSNIKMTEARGAFHVVGELVPLEGPPPVMREDMVRVGMGTADIRYRGEFVTWAATLTIRYNAAVMEPAQIINLLNNAGFGVGVGEWRPERNGSHGMFHVKTH